MNKIEGEKKALEILGSPVLIKKFKRGWRTAGCSVLFETKSEALQRGRELKIERNKETILTGGSNE